MKTLSTILFVALIIVTGSEYDSSTKSQTVYLSENSISIFEDRNFEENLEKCDLEHPIYLREIPNNIEDLSQNEELEAADASTFVELKEIKLELEDLNYLIELENCEM